MYVKVKDMQSVKKINRNNSIKYAIVKFHFYQNWDNSFRSKRQLFLTQKPTNKEDEKDGLFLANCDGTG